MERERFEELAERLRNRERGYWYRFYGGTSQAEIAAAEAALGVPLPPGFRWFLAEFGGAELGATIFGVGAGCTRTVVDATRQARRAFPPLPRRLVPFAEETAFLGLCHGGWAITYCCFDTSRRVQGEYPVVRWEAPRSSRGRLRLPPLLRALRRPAAPPDAPFFLDWLAETLNEDASGAVTPNDWADGEAWEWYWRHVLAEDGARDGHPSPWRHSASRLYALLDLLPEAPVRRVLCAGNGIDLLPYALAHRGCDVTALDVSPAASHFVTTAAPSRDDLERFFPVFTEGTLDAYGVRVCRPDRERIRERMAREHRPGGRVTVVTADLFTWTPARPFDLILSERAFQGFDAPLRARLARRFHAWLRPGGLCAVQTQNVVWGGGAALREMEQPFRDAGFFIQDGEPEHRLALARMERTPARRVAALSERAAAAAAVEAQRRAAGERMAVFWHDSG